MKTLMKRLQKWFDLNLGWFFTNGNKQDEWSERIKSKYPEDYQKSLTKK